MPRLENPMVHGHFERYKEGPASVVEIVGLRQSPGIDPGIDPTNHLIGLKESNLFYIT